MFTVEQLYNQCIEMIKKYGCQGGVKQLKVEGIGELSLIAGELTVYFSKKEIYPFNFTQQCDGFYPANLDWLNRLPDLLARMEARIKDIEAIKNKPIPVANNLQQGV